MKLANLFGKNQLDEMQEHTMLTIESRGFWLIWSLLFVVLLVEGLLDFTMREMAGTWAVFMISCVYIVVACLRAGLWSRNIKATIGANLVGSLIAGAVVGVFVFIKMSAYDAPLSIMLAGAGIAAGTTFVLALVVLQLCSAAYKKRHEQLENEFDENEFDKEEKDN